MSILNISSRALLANQAALQTAGNNIANVNTPGYSRQSTVFAATPGQFTGGGYVGKGVDLITIQRNHDEFLTQQSAASASVSAYDQLRATKLGQVQDVFTGGANGLGAAVNDLLNAFSDVANAPTDLTARAIVLTRADEAAGRFQTAAARLDELRLGTRQELDEQIRAINGLAERIAQVNDQIAAAQGSGQPPNDLLDQRDQLIRELNQYVQTTQVAADDGSVSVFIGRSQALVLGADAAQLNRVADPNYPADPDRDKLAIVRGASTVVVEESTLGGGETAALLRFQNTDLAEASNLLGRLAVTITDVLNEQHRLGVDLDGNSGNNLFNPSVLTTPVGSPSNSVGSTLGVAINDPTQLVAADYEVRFTAADAGFVVRQSDGRVTNFGPAAVSPITVDGLDLSFGGTAAGDRFLVKPFTSAASRMDTAFSSPRQLAMANPIEPVVAVTNRGSLAVDSLTVATGYTTPGAGGVTLTFTGPNTYTLAGSTTPAPGPGFTYTPGQAIVVDGWTLDLRGSAVTGDVLTIQAATPGYRDRNAGNADALLALRDLTAFDGAALSDGYAGAMSQIGIRVQSAQYASEISQAIASNLERDRTAVSGVNLDEEAARLLQFQQAYQSSAKMLQVAQTVFDTLLSTFR